ncbi:YecA family protein [Chlamydia caviae]|uniref:Protein translocase subunit, putative n=1 Tax=Chlamydia caviae (strain ATCC VR-813 / DSM 19441 / 03DC25 / GPIC) TaxID=227941 RepID=Q823A4_CHLCV|nr:SEC-C metal-binding domain-containing protein [Chlamydia caviae]AAP05265.1 protein translocase subunit, putative [Chlamydia caviae GPIC]
MSKKINRNDPCPCGSNKKYKQCCLAKESQSARYTSEGKFKFSAQVLPSGQEGSSCTQLFQRLSESLTSEQKQAVNKYHEITKNKTTPGKKTIKKAQAEEERLVSEQLKKHNFQVMETNLSADALAGQMNQDTSFVSEDFIPTQEDYRIAENTDSDLEENNQ